MSMLESDRPSWSLKFRIRLPALEDVYKRQVYHHLHIEARKLLRHQPSDVAEAHQSNGCLLYTSLRRLNFIPLKNPLRSVWSILPLVIAVHLSLIPFSAFLWQTLRYMAIPRTMKLNISPPNPKTANPSAHNRLPPALQPTVCRNTAAYNTGTKSVRKHCEPRTAHAKSRWPG